MRTVSFRISDSLFACLERRASERGECRSATARHFFEQALREEDGLRRDVTLMHVLQIGGIINKLAAHVSPDLLQKGKEDGLRMAREYGLIRSDPDSSESGR